MLAEMTQAEITFWWISLALGLIVAAAAVALLSWLVHLVREIDRGVQAVWEMGKQVAANTATTWMLGQTSEALKEIKEEALIHDRFLSSKVEP